MEEGRAVSAGRSRSRAASTVKRSSSKNAGRFIAEGNRLAAKCQSGSRFGLPLGIERLNGKFAIGFLEKDFHATFSFLELLLAFAREGNAFFEKLHGVVEGELRAFEASDDFLQASQRALKVRLLRRFGFLGSR